MTFEHALWEVIKLGRFRITVHFTKLFGPHLNCRRIYETLSFHYSLSLVHIFNLSGWGVLYGMSVTGKFSKAMIRQQNEAIRIRECTVVYKMNSRREFHQPSIIRMLPIKGNIQLDETGRPATTTMQRYRPQKRKADRPLAPPREDSPTILTRSRSTRIRLGTLRDPEASPTSSDRLSTGLQSWGPYVDTRRRTVRPRLTPKSLQQHNKTHGERHNISRDFGENWRVLTEWNSPQTTTSDADVGDTVEDSSCNNTTLRTHHEKTMRPLPISPSPSPDISLSPISDTPLPSPTPSPNLSPVSPQPLTQALH